MPTKEELCKKYKLSKTDFIILTKLPSQNELMGEGAFLEKLGFWERFEVWQKKTIIGGVLLAICLIGAMRDGIETLLEGGQVIYANAPQIENYTQHFSDYIGTQAKGLLVHKWPHPTEEDMKHQQWATLPTGSGIYPASGNWIPS